LFAVHHRHPRIRRIRIAQQSAHTG
jgi:hypothetical protein